MTERRFSDRDLEAALRDVGAHLSYPAEADLLPAVRARIDAERAASFWAIFRAPRVAFLPALATVLLILVAALAFQPVGASALEALGIRGLTVVRGPEVPPGGPGSAILADAKRVASVEAASREVGFTVRAPTSVVGAAPDEVYVRTREAQAQAILVYRPRAAIPASKVAGVGMLIIETRGKVAQSLFGKLVPPGGRIEPLTVNGGPGIWIEGDAHQFFYLTPEGNILADSVRLAGNVLAWEQDGLLFRIEAQVARDTALRLAAAMR